ncbi:FtsH protease activity modulator HflK [Larsenimonas suaedae]|uniref:Protein HflK n=1 Tax=Larsenimonas suaedae TaxID=1851019 RepID=A0ABU1GZW6_9GAMM|nr:FtsH protease activity modulator HflK [Larsenimonas suaedae]MCM2972853.1 FtsH protease activity modulator HflK [Larsenimonas suaedae]MDR5896952.1 FtsH protease activity modulator HflK [Larsenimonas suaedae]
MAWNEPGGGKNNSNDPWGGGGRNDNGDRRPNNNGNGGPPDLDEALKDLQNKLGGLFGKKNGGGNNNGNGQQGGDGGDHKRNAFALPALVVVVLSGVWFASGFYLVDQSERGVVLRFGEYTETVGPGLHWNAPFVDEVREVNVTKVRSLTQTASMLTQDENIVKVKMSVQYVVSNPRDYVLNVRAPEMSLENATDSALRYVAGQTEMNDILTSGRELLASNVTTRLQSYLDAYGVGLQLKAVNVESTSAPDQVQDAFDDVIRAREDRERSINEARGYANSVLPQARGEAYRMEREADIYSRNATAQAQGEANRFLSLNEAYVKAPDITRERLYLDTMSDIFSHTNKALVNVSGGNAMMYLPLDKLGQNAGGSNASGSINGSDNASALKSIANDVVNSSSSRNSTLREGR